MKKKNQFDPKFHPWPGWPNGTPWCSRCTFKAKDDYERLAERMMEQMHLYASGVRTEPHQTGEGYNNLVRYLGHMLRFTGRNGIRKALLESKKP